MQGLHEDYNLKAACTGPNRPWCESYVGHTPSAQQYLLDYVAAVESERRARLGLFHGPMTNQKLQPSPAFACHTGQVTKQGLQLNTPPFMMKLDDTSHTRLLTTDLPPLTGMVNNEYFDQDCRLDTLMHGSIINRESSGIGLTAGDNRDGNKFARMRWDRFGYQSDQMGDFRPMSQRPSFDPTKLRSLKYQDLTSTIGLNQDDKYHLSHLGANTCNINRLMEHRRFVQTRIMQSAKEYPNSWTVPVSMPNQVSPKTNKGAKDETDLWKLLVDDLPDMQQSREESNYFSQLLSPDRDNESSSLSGKTRTCQKSTTKSRLKKTSSGIDKKQTAAKRKSKKAKATQTFSPQSANSKLCPSSTDNNSRESSQKSSEKDDLSEILLQILDDGLTPQAVAISPKARQMADGDSEVGVCTEEDTLELAFMQLSRSWASTRDLHAVFRTWLEEIEYQSLLNPRTTLWTGLEYVKKFSDSVHGLETIANFLYADTGRFQVVGMDKRGDLIWRCLRLECNRNEPAGKALPLLVPTNERLGLASRSVSCSSVCGPDTGRGDNTE